MASSFEGLVNDELQKLGETLFDGAQVRLDDIDEQLKLTLALGQPRFFPLYYASAAGDEYLYLYPPKARVWILHEARLMLDTDSNVANRTFTIAKEFLRPSGTWGPVERFLEATVAADGQYHVNLHAAASADPHSEVDSYLNLEELYLVGKDLKGQGQERLTLQCADKEAGDRMYVHVSIEERINFML